MYLLLYLYYFTNTISISVSSSKTLQTLFCVLESALVLSLMFRATVKLSFSGNNVWINCPNERRIHMDKKLFTTSK